MPIYSIKYSIPYLILITYYILLVVTEFIVEKQPGSGKLSSNRQIIKILSFSGLLLFFGFRGFIGWDWYLYYPGFKEVHNIFNFDPTIFSHTHFDHGFIYYMSLIKTISSNYHFFIFLNTLIDIIILSLLIKRYARFSYAFVTLFFIVMGGFYLETDILRSAKCLMLFLLSLRYINERKIVPYFLLNLLGCTFHLTACIFLPLYFFLHKKISKYIVISIFITGFLIFFMQIEYIRPFLYWITSHMGERFLALLEKYLNISAYSTAYGFTIGLLERMFTVILIIIFYDRLTGESKQNILLVNSYLIYFIFFFFFAEIKIIPVRLGGLFVFAYWFLYPKILNYINNFNNKIIILSAFFIYSLIKIGDMTNTILYRYVNVLFFSDDFPSRAKIFDSSVGTLFK